MTGADITVAVATLDRPAGLARCLEALLAGSVLPGEILVVDQGASATTEPLLDRLRTAAVPLRHLVQAGHGLAASRNAALRAAHGRILAVTDDDCVPHSRWVAEIVDAFSAGDVAAVTGPVLPLGGSSDGREVSLRLDRSDRRFSGRMPPWRVGTGGNFAARRSALAAIGGYEERLGTGSPGRAGEDLEVVHRLLRRGEIVLYRGDAVVLHARQTARRRWATRWTYGHGVGAFLGMRLRGRDGSAPRLLAEWVAMRGRRLAGGLRRADLRLAAEELLVLGGTARGLVYGLGSPPRPLSPARPDGR
jgi:glycosyltransferase involved in cell wall biosynthesis